MNAFCKCGRYPLVGGMPAVADGRCTLCGSERFDAAALGIDPGVRLLVEWLVDRGYNTTDSGDGVTKADLIASGDALDMPHVAMMITRERMVEDADRLHALLVSAGIEPTSGSGTVVIEASYNPACGGPAILLLHGLNDVMLLAAQRAGGR